MKVYVMTAEHFSCPPIIMKVCATRDIAVKEAISCVNIMCADSGIPPCETEDEMDDTISVLQDTHGAAHCYAEITECEVIDA